MNSLAVGRKVGAAADRVAPALRVDLTTAPVLHDIGYGHFDTGLHALDGARFLAGRSFSPVVCNLVVHHSASTIEAEERGTDWLSMQTSRWTRTSARRMRCCGGPT